MGPPGSSRQENALFLAEHFGWKCITTGDLLRKEVAKKSTLGQQISDSFKQFSYGKYKFLSVSSISVDDQIVIDLVKKEIE